MRLQFVLIMLLIFRLSDSSGQITEGKIIYDISYADSRIDSTLLSMLPTKGEVMFKKNLLRMDMQMGNGWSNRMYVDNATGVLHYLTETPSSKTDIVISADEKRFKERQDTRVVYTEEQKTIAGLACKKALVKSEDNKQYEIWLTDAIAVDNSRWNDKFSGVKGFMMEFAMNQGSINMKMVASEVQQVPVSDDSFVIPEGYHQIKSSDLDKLNKK